MTSNERKKYANPSPGHLSKKREASESSKSNEKKRNRGSLGDFINDETENDGKNLSGESDDISLVSESDLEEESPTAVPKEKKNPTGGPNVKAASTGVKKFTWT